MRAIWTYLCIAVIVAVLGLLCVTKPDAAGVGNAERISEVAAPQGMPSISDPLAPAHYEEPRPAQLPLPVPNAAFLDSCDDSSEDDDLERLASGPLAAIRIEGNERRTTEEILKVIRTEIDRVADPNLIKADIRTLLGKRWFFSVEARVARSKAGPVLVFRVLEKPILEKVTYIGNKKFKERVLADLTGLKAGSGYDVGTNRESARRIESHYRDRGYFHTKVTLEKGDSPDDREVVFRVDEGPKAAMAKIRFEGNRSVPEHVLQLQLKEKMPVVWLGTGRRESSKISDGIRAMEQYYRNLGFFDVKITYREQDIRSRAELLFIIDEGACEEFRNVEFNE